MNSALIKQRHTTISQYIEQPKTLWYLC